MLSQCEGTNKQFWQFKEIYSFTNYSHLGRRSGLCDTNLKGDQGLIEFGSAVSEEKNLKGIFVKSAFFAYFHQKSTKCFGKTHSICPTTRQNVTSIKI